MIGPGLHPEALGVARAVAGERGARLVEAGEDPGVAVGALGAYQRRNFAVAKEAARAYLGIWTPRRLPRRPRRCACRDGCRRSTTIR